MSVEQGLLTFLRMQSFSGNVRELENAVVRMLFAKNHGTSLNLDDWYAQAGEEQATGDRDLIGDAAQNLWEAISRSELSYAHAIQKLEKTLLATALLAGGRTRRDVAKRLRTSERNLYHMIRTHRLGSRPGI